MKYSELVDCLYGGNHYNILRILNSSIYVTHYKPKTEYAYVISTGFTFRIHTEKRFDILYDLDDEIIIRQNRNENSIPLINGLLLQRDDSRFFGSFSKLHFSGISKDDNLIVSQGLIEDPYLLMNNKFINKFNVKDETKIKEINKFVIFNSADNSILKEYPLNLNYDSVFFLRYNEFSDYYSWEDYEADKEEIRKEFENSDRQSIGDWLINEYGDDASDAAWNID